MWPTFQIHSLRKLYIISTSIRGLSGWIFLLPNRWAWVLFKSVLFDRGSISNCCWHYNHITGRYGTLALEPHIDRGQHCGMRGMLALQPLFFPVAHDASLQHRNIFESLIPPQHKKLPACLGLGGPAILICYLGAAYI